VSDGKPAYSGECQIPSPRESFAGNRQHHHRIEDPNGERVKKSFDERSTAKQRLQNECIDQRHSDADRAVKFPLESGGRWHVQSRHYLK
jgi:hypothetical protein